MKTISQLMRLWPVYFFILFTIPCYAQQPKLGDTRDGNRSVPVHLLNLYDEEGSIVRMDDHPVMPFSTKQTCIECHDYKKISGGWHFNALNPEKNSGRPGEPWILVDPLTATQIPLSYRGWPGTFPPKSIGLTSWGFTLQFGRHIPGGSAGEDELSDSTDLLFRRMVSGKLEINCLSCHSKNPAQDQAEYAMQITRENFRWAITGASGFASVYGAARDMPDNFDIYYGVDPDNPRNIPPNVEYDKSKFNSKGKVFFDLVRKIPNERCYFCHSTTIPAKESLEADEDVHITAGMSCVDCHRNDINHSMNRGYEGEKPALTSLTCKGCHLGEENPAMPKKGRFGAPQPEHKGIPPLHLEKLTCTACHSGPWPDQNRARIKTSRAHSLGTHTVYKSNQALPHLQLPVFVKNKTGRIEPHKLLWPSYWAYSKGDSLLPISPQTIAPIIIKILVSDTLTDSTNFAKIRLGTWPEFTDSLIGIVLDSLYSNNPKFAKPVYVTGGSVMSVSASGNIQSQPHPGAEPYSWAFAHDVRPAAQSLGVRGCDDCHNLSSPFYFGKVTVPTPLISQPQSFVSMTTFNQLGDIFPRIFAISFFFRPWLKFFIIISSSVIILILLLYTLKGLDCLVKSLSKKK